MIIFQQKVLQRVHHISRIPKIGPQHLPSPAAFKVTIIVYSTRSFRIDVFGPHFSLDEQNDKVVNTALV